MKNYWQVSVMLIYGGTEHIWSELTPEAKDRIHHEFGQGKTRGQLRDEDFKA